MSNWLYRAQALWLAAIACIMLAIAFEAPGSSRQVTAIVLVGLAACWVFATSTRRFEQLMLDLLDEKTAAEKRQVAAKMMARVAGHIPVALSLADLLWHVSRQPGVLNHTAFAALALVAVAVIVPRAYDLSDESEAIVPAHRELFYYLPLFSMSVAYISYLAGASWFFSVVLVVVTLLFTFYYALTLDKRIAAWERSPKCKENEGVARLVAKK